jgi:hypothetical protein
VPSLTKWKGAARYRRIRRQNHRSHEDQRKRRSVGRPQQDSNLDLDLPGFLEGSSGIALALHTYATNHPPAGEWDTVLTLR